MSYVVLARKWRPRFFEEVVGQGHVAQTLKNSIEQDRVAHAYLFTGSRGVGKTTTARILSKALNCHKGPAKTPCYQCPSCLEISNGQAIDVFEIDGASNRGINEIRELREGARYAPNRDRFKIYIIDEVHMLTTEAFNALLKTLEEPPPHVKFIFATTEPQKIPITILSRCQRFDFKRINQQDIVHHLEQICQQENIQTDKTSLQLIARQAAGGMRDALSLLDQVISFAGMNIDQEQVVQILGVANRKHLFDLSAAILTRNTQLALTTLDEVHRYGYDLSQFVGELVQHFRDLTVAKAVEHPERVTSLTETELQHVGALIAQVQPDILHRCFQVIIQGAQEMSKSTYPKLILEMTLVRMCQLEPLVGLDLLVEKLVDLEDLLGDGDEGKKKIEPLTLPTSAPQPTTPPIISPPVASPPQPPQPEPTQSVTPAVPNPFEAPTPPSEPPSPEPPAPQPIEPAQSSVPDPFEPLPSTPLSKPVEPPKQDTPPTYLSAPDIGTPPEEPKIEFTPPPPVEIEPEPEAQSAPQQTQEEEEYIIPEVPSWMSDDPISEEELAELLDENQPPTIDLHDMEPMQAWKSVVDYIRRDTAPLAATLEHAYVDHFTKQVLHLTFVNQYYHFIHDEMRREQLAEALQTIFGEGFDVTLDLRPDPSDSEPRTLAQWRDVANQAREKTLRTATRMHPAVLEAQELFDPLKCTISIELSD